MSDGENDPIVDGGQPSPRRRSWLPVVVAGIAVAGAMVAGSAYLTLPGAEARSGPMAGDSIAVPPKLAQTYNVTYGDQEGELIEWQEERDGTKTYVFEGLRITLRAKANADGPPSPVIRIERPGLAPFEYEGVAGLSRASARFGVGRFEPGDGPQVIFTAYSGGAHCCTEILVFTAGRSGWTTTEAGEWNGEGLSAFPRDIDRDGRADFELFDSRFDYAFGPHATSRMPPRIYNLVNGHWTDVSAGAAYRPLFERDVAEARRDCEQHSNPGCAAYVADAARLGQAREAWAFMLQNYDRSDSWELPEGCRVTPGPNETCPEAQTIRFDSFPAALEWFLRDTGYLTGPPIGTP